MGVARQSWIAKPGLISVAALAALAAVLPAARSAAAPTFLGPSPYLQTSDSPFAADISAGRMFLETFEDNLLNTPGVTVNAGSSVLAPGGATDSVDGDDGAIDGNGNGGHSLFNANGPGGIRFTFDPAALGGNLPTRAGIVWTDGNGDVTFEAFGVTDPNGISAISISNGGGGIEVDHLQYGTPEPGAASLLLLPAAAGMLRRRRCPHGGC